MPFVKHVLLPRVIVIPVMMDIIKIMEPVINVLNRVQNVPTLTLVLLNAVHVQMDTS